VDRKRGSPNLNAWIYASGRVVKVEGGTELTRQPNQDQPTGGPETGTSSTDRLIH
jgi:hypothetical protein